MMRSMFAGVSGMRSHQMMMDVIGDNIANVNTSGYKSSRVVFQDTLSQMMRDGAAGTAATGSTNPSQVGLGVKVNAVDAVVTQGAIQNTGRPTDLAIQGPGYFVVSTEGQTAYSRAGAFGLDDTGRVVDPSGAVLQGWLANPDGTLGDTTAAPVGLSVPDSFTDATGTYDLRSFAIGSDGVLTAVYSDGTPRSVGQIALASFSNPAGLTKNGNGHLLLGPAAGPAQVGAAGSGDRGSLATGALEMSNVDLAQEFTNLMIAQRGFQANSRIISASDELLQELVNLKR